MGEINQLQPISIQLIIDDLDPKKSYNTHGTGEITLSEFMNPTNEHVTINYSFHMTDVVMQKGEKFKEIISSMRKGTMSKD